MAKKKKRRKKTTKKQMKAELLGLLFILLAILGSGAGSISDGAIPSILENLFRFFFGIWYFIASLILLVVGVFILIKRRYPNFINKKMIGLLIGFLGVLLLTHIQTFERLLVTTPDTSIIKLTWNNFFSYIRGQVTASQVGGGMVGGILFTFSYFLFSSVGAKIIAVFSLIIGLLFMTDLSLGEFCIKIWGRFKVSLEKMRGEIKQKRKLKQGDNVVDVPIETINLPIDADVENPVAEEPTEISYSFDQSLDQENSVDKQNTAEDVDDEIVIHSSGIQMVENYDYVLPSMDLLGEPTHHSLKRDEAAIRATISTLEETFKSFGVKAKVTKVHVGPAVTKYEIYPEAGVKVSRIVSLHDDLALALAAQDIRIEAPIPGKSAVGIEIPNKEVAMVSLREVLDVPTGQNSKLLFALGRNISGDAVVGELNKMPHLLIAGATGSGKSVCINGIITTILMRTKPHEVKMMMIDPKKVELNVYNGIPHLLTPVVTDPKKASQALKKVVAEMERRYELFSETGTRNIESYNDYLHKEPEADKEKVIELPYIVVIVDELADLMMVASKDVEDSITRLAQMARAAGIHLIIATQRPSVDVITGVIKANIPSRIAFSVSSQIDSRTILDTGGAEKLLGRGDMLYIPVGMSKPMRVQGAFLSDDEVERVVEHCMNQQQVVYQEEMIPETTSETVTDVDDEIYDEAVKLVVEMQTASVSMLQRRFRIGYTRAARLIDAMEDRGIVGPYEGSKPRTVLISPTDEEKTP